MPTRYITIEQEVDIFDHIEIDDVIDYLNDLTERDRDYINRNLVPRLVDEWNPAEKARYILLHGFGGFLTKLADELREMGRTDLEYEIRDYNRTLEILCNA